MSYTEDGGNKDAHRNFQPRRLRGKLIIKCIKRTNLGAAPISAEAFNRR